MRPGEALVAQVVKITPVKFDWAQPDPVRVPAHQGSGTDQVPRPEHRVRARGVDR